FDGVPIGWRQIDQESQQVAHYLSSLGADRGQRVAIFAENSVDWMIAYFGALITGAIVVPINTMFHGEGLISTLRHADASILITGGTLQSRVEDVRDQLNTVLHHVGIAAPQHGIADLRTESAKFAGLERL